MHKNNLLGLLGIIAIPITIIEALIFGQFNRFIEQITIKGSVLLNSAFIFYT